MPDHVQVGALQHLQGKEEEYRTTSSTLSLEAIYFYWLSPSNHQLFCKSTVLVLVFFFWQLKRINAHSSERERRKPACVGSIFVHAKYGKLRTSKSLWNKNTWNCFVPSQGKTTTMGSYLSWAERPCPFSLILYTVALARGVLMNKVVAFT